MLHMGAKTRQLPASLIADPQGMLNWLGPDRAVLEFRSAAELAERRDALVAIVRQWITHV